MLTPVNKKRLLLSVAGLASFAAAYGFNHRGEVEVAVVEPVSRAANSGNSGNAGKAISATNATNAGKVAKPAMFASGAQTLPPSTLQKPARTMVVFENEKDIFSAHSWLPPAPPLPPPPRQVATPVPPPAAPMAPPLPFSFFGSLDEKGLGRRVFLTKGDQLVIVKASDVIEGQYRVDRIIENAVDMTYLPLNQKQSMFIQQGGL
jgi:hypothetical protein